jgi:putative ABC transport system permease protein
MSVSHPSALAYGWLLRLYPAEFRQEYGSEMRADFAHRAREASARGVVTVIALWIHVLADTLHTAAAVHVDIAARDIRSAWRGLRRDRAFAWSAAGTLALGTGVALTGVAVLSAVLLRPLPYPTANRLVVLSELDPQRGRWPIAEPTLLDLQREVRGLDLISGFRLGRGALTLPASTESVSLAAVSPSMFALLGLPPDVGRTFSADADRFGSGVAELVATRRYWRQVLHAQTSSIPASLALDGVAYQLVGVVDPPPGLFDGVDVFVPLQPNPQGSRTARELTVVARQAPGMTPDRLTTSLAAETAVLESRRPARDAGWTLRAIDLRAYLLGPYVTRLVWTLAGSVALLWLLACVNIAGLVSARLTVTLQTLGVRSALGASRARLLREIVTSAGVLAVVGSAAGLLCASGATGLVRYGGAALLSQLAGVHLDALTWTVAGAMTIIAALWCAAIPAFALGGLRMREALASGGRGGSAKRRTRTWLVGTQVAIALVLVACAGLLVRSYDHLVSIDPGFDPDRLLTVQISLNRPGMTATQRTDRLRAIADTLSTLPGVRHIGATSVAPLGPMSTANRFRLEGGSADDYLVAAWRAVTPGFFSTVGMRALRGRVIDESDRDGAEEVVVITQSMAARFWPDRDPLGLRLLWGSSGSPKRIIGIVPDLRDITIGADPVPTMFRPFAQLTPPDMTLLVSASIAPSALIAPVRARLRDVAPDLPARIEPLSTAVSSSLVRPRVSAWVFAAFGLASLALATTGLYGLVAYDVVHRRRETAIRRALGATNRGILWELERGAMLTAGIGTAIGLIATLAMGRAMQALLTGTTATDPFLLAAAALLLIATAWLAVRVAARGALRVNASEALRAD